MNNETLINQFKRFLSFSRHLSDCREEEKEEILNLVLLRISQFFPGQEEIIDRFLCQINDSLLAFFKKEKSLSPQKKIILKAQEYIKENYSRPVKLQEIAKHVGASGEALCRLFKKQTATTVTAYLNEIRIKRSVDLLKETNDSITEIAYSCGFNNVSYYCVTFREKMKMPPGKWRKFQ